MLGTLALVPVRKHHHQAREPLPLGLGRADELVDDGLGHVGEVAILRFPDVQGIGLGQRVAVLIAQDRQLREGRVVDVEARLIACQVAQRDVAALRPFGVLVVDLRVAMEEGATARVLPDEPDSVPLGDQGRVGEVLGHAPVEGQGSREHVAASLEDRADALVRLEAFRKVDEALAELLEALDGNSRVHGGAPVRIAADVLGPAAGVLRGDIGLDRLGHALTGIQGVTVGIDELLGLVSRDDAFALERFDVEAAGARVHVDEAVHHRLRRAGLVRLVVAVAAEADEVDEDVLVELHPVVLGQLHREDRRLRVVAVDMEDGRIDELGDVRAVTAGAGILRVRDAEAHLVIDDQVKRTAGGEAAELREVEGLGHDALAADGGVTVDDHGKDEVAGLVMMTILASANRALDDGGDDLEVRRVEGQGQVNRTAFGRHIRREAEVVLHVAGDVARKDVLALELIEEVARLLAHDVDEHVEAAAVGHAEDDFLDALLARAPDQLIQHRDDGVSAFQREALLADVALVEVALEAFGRVELVEDLTLGGRVEARPPLDRLDAVLQPLALDARQVGVLEADGLAVGLLERVEDLLEAALKIAFRDLARQVRLGEAVVLGIQLGHPALGTSQRIELGFQVPHRAIGIDQRRHSGPGVGRGLGGHDVAPPVLSQLGERPLDGRVRRLRPAGRTPNPLEVLPPFGSHGEGIVKEILVEAFDETCVSTVHDGGVSGNLQVHRLFSFKVGAVTSVEAAYALAQRPPGALSARAF
ncbi:hypothetical protein D3C87_649790 [compost metagenome]